MNEKSPRIANKNNERHNSNGINDSESNTLLNYNSRMFVCNRGETHPKGMDSKLI